MHRLTSQKKRVLSIAVAAVVINAFAPKKIKFSLFMLFVPALLLTVQTLYLVPCSILGRLLFWNL